MDRDFRLNRDLFTAWHEGLAGVLDPGDADDKPQLLCDALRSLFEFDCGALFVLRAHSAPIRLFDEFPREPIDYVTSPYLLDPVYIQFRQNKLPPVATIRDISPRGFRESEYFRTYMKRIDIADELSFNIAVDNATTLHFAIARQGNRDPFEKKDKLLAESLYPIVSVLLTHHWQSLGSNIAEIEAEAEDFHNFLDNVIESFGKDVLTDREREIVRLTLHGNTDKLTARALGITPGTVRNHKKNIFSKLRVSSQGQLFGLFLDALESSEQLPPDEDPLATLLATREA